MNEFIFSESCWSRPETLLKTNSKTGFKNPLDTSLGLIDLSQRHFCTENYSHIMFFVVMAHEIRVCFSKNAPVIKVVVDNNDHIPSNSQNPPDEFEIEESHLVELRESK